MIPFFFIHKRETSAQDVIKADEIDLFEIKC
jgi:hypothetical protein